MGASAIPLPRREDTAPPQLPRRGLTSRLSVGHLVMLVSGLLAAVLVYSATRQDTARVAVAARQLPAGTRVNAASFAFADFDAGASDQVLASLLGPDSIDEVSGWVAATSIEAGELVTRSALRAPAAPDAQRAMSVPIAPSRAAGGALAAGDRVDVIEVVDGTARYVVTDAPVLAVSAATASGLAAANPAGGYSITVAVDAEEALRLAAAVERGAMSVVRATGAPTAIAGRAAVDPGTGRER